MERTKPKYGVSGDLRPSLTACSLSKSFGSVQALSDVSLDFYGGEVHAVLGENGAGKSTLMSVLSGFLVPDSGSVQYKGVSIPLGKPFECRKMGIEMIHQHFMLVPEFTVEENLALVNMPGLFLPIRVSGQAERALSMAKRLGWEVDPKALVRGLPVGTQQRIEILKAVAGEAQVLIFDEPTAVLAPGEVADLFRVLRQFALDGKAVILIAHKLSEVLSVADRISVLRRGKLVGTGARANFDEDSLAQLMVGELPPPGITEPSKLGDRKFEIQDLVVLGNRGEKAVQGVTFELRAGELLGIGGVDGNGQVELAECLAGIRSAIGGTIKLDDDPLDPEKSRIAYIPQDRQADGLALEMSIAENMLISGQHNRMFIRSGWISVRRWLEWASSLIKKFSIMATSPLDRVSQLSGGNQQKVVVSRAFDMSPALIVVLNPTRGLDIRATDFVHAALRRACHEGAAIALFTTDLDELYALSDRRLFMSRGRLLEESGVKGVVGG